MPCWYWSLIAREGSRGGPSAADTLGAGAAGPWNACAPLEIRSGGATHLWQVRRTLSNVRRACLSRLGGVLSYPLLTPFTRRAEIWVITSDINGCMLVFTYAWQCIRLKYQ